MFFTIFTVLFAQQVGLGKLFVRESDNQEWIKDQLIYDALKDAMLKKMDEMGLDINLFKQKYNQALDAYLLPLKNDLSQKINMEEPDILPEEKTKREAEYATKLRELTFKSQKEVLNLNHVVKSFSSGPIRYSEMYSSLANIQVNAIIDQNIVYEIFGQFTGETKSNYNGLFLGLDINVGTSLSDVELYRLKTNLLNTWLKFLRDAEVSAQIADSRILDAILKNTEDGPKPTSFIGDLLGRSNPLLAYVQIKLGKSEASLINDRVDFSMKGDLMLLGKDQKVILSNDFEEFGFDIKDLENRILGQVSKFMGTVKDTVPNVRHYDGEISLRIENVKNVLELDEVSNIIKDKLISFAPWTKIVNYNAREGLFSLKYIGNNDDLVKKILLMDGEKGGNFRLMVKNLDSDMSIYLDRDYL